MTLMEAAQKWGLSPNWVRELVKSGKVRSKLRDDVPVPYYEIPDNETPPPRRFARKATGKVAATTSKRKAVAKAPARKSKVKRDV